MRTLTIGRAFFHLLKLMAAAVMILFAFVPVKAHMMIYPLARQVAMIRTATEADGMAVRETPHFSIRFTAADREYAPAVEAASEKAYEEVTRLLGYAPRGRVMVIIEPDRDSLGRAFGWIDGQTAMGVYWGGSIRMLTPRQWLGRGGLDEMIRTGPMVHELTHLVLDYQTAGNYPRWFTEGLAQYAEYRINGYEWLTGGNTLRTGRYTPADLEDFDRLPNQPLAYRESFAAVRYIAEVHGEDRLRGVIGRLRAGRPAEQAIAETLGMSYADYGHSWQTWSARVMARPASL